MLDLSSLTILRNAENLIKEANQWKDSPTMIKGRDEVTAALKDSNLTAPVFSDMNFPKYALLAYQYEQISEAQFTSLLLYWAAKKDYPDSHMSNLKVHKLTAEDYTTQQTLSQYLQLQTFNHGLFEQYSIHDDLNKDVKNDIIKHLLSDEVPSSERCFFTFEIDAEEPTAELFMGIKRTGFDLFMPIQKNGKMVVIIPSYSMVQTALNHLAPHPKTLLTRIGDDTFDDVFNMHVNDEHPFGLSFPGFEKEEADKLKSGRLGFALHDIYHVTLLSFTPHKELFKELVQVAKVLHSNTELDCKAHFQEAMESIIDNEFRQYTQGNTFGQLQPEELKEFLSSKEMAIITALLGILVKTVVYDEALKELDTINTQEISEERKQQVLNQEEELKKLNNEKALPNKLKFIQRFLTQLFITGGRLDNEQIDLAKMVDLLLDEKRIIQSLFGPEESRRSFGVSVLFIDAGVKSIGSIKDLLVDLLNNPQSQQNINWLKQYNELKLKLKKAVTSNDTATLKAIFANKSHQKFIAHVDRIYGETPPLVEQAVSLGHLEVVKLLHEEGAQLNSTMLLTALQHNDLAMLEFLLAAGVDAYALDAKNLSVIDYCLEQGNTEALKLLLNYVSLSQEHLLYLEHKKIKIHQECTSLLERYKTFKDKLHSIHECYDAERRVELLKELVSTNTDNFSYATQIELHRSDSMDQRYIESRKAADSGMYEPFICSLNSESELQILSKGQSINFNQKRSDGTTPLLYSLGRLEYGWNPDKIREQCEFFITHGANVTAVNEDGKSTLMLAMQDEDFKLIEVLKKNGAKFSMRNEQPNCLKLLFKMLANNKWNGPFEKALNILVLNGFNLNQKALIQISRGWMDFMPEIKLVTPWSMLRGQPIESYSIFAASSSVLDMPLETRKMCIELGADPNELSYDGQLELNTAITNGWNDYLLLLLEKKADPNAIDKNGDSPMHVAAQKGDEQTMQVLRKHGAKSFPNNSGQTPEDILSHKLSVTATIQLGLFQSKEIGGSLPTLDSASSSPQQL